MKKYFISLGIGLAISGAAIAQTMDTRVYTVTSIGTNAASQTFVLRGELESLYVDVTATKTQTVAVASAFGTAFSAAITADAVYYPRVQEQTSAGAAITSGSTTNTSFGKFPMAGPVTLTVTPAADTTGTNTTTVTVIYKP